MGQVGSSISIQFENMAARQLCGTREIARVTQGTLEVLPPQEGPDLHIAPAAQPAPVEAAGQPEGEQSRCKPEQLLPSPLAWPFILEVVLQEQDETSDLAACRAREPGASHQAARRGLPGPDA